MASLGCRSFQLMCVPEKKHLFHKTSPKAGSERCELHPPAQPGKDAILWGREQHQGQAGASSTQQQTNQGDSWALFYVKHIKAAEHWESSQKFPFSDRYSNCQAEFLANTLWSFAFSVPKQIETLDYFLSDHSWWTAARLQSRWYWVWFPVPSQKIKFQEFKCRWREMSPLHNTLYWEKKKG